jgi:hypothetical protein
MVLSSSSESSGESLKGDLVETAFRDIQALESSFPLHRAVLEDDEKTIRVLLRQSEVHWLKFFVEPWESLTRCIGELVSTRCCLCHWQCTQTSHNLSNC